MLGRPRDFHDIDEALHMHLVEYVAEHVDKSLDVALFGRAVREWISCHAISWTRMHNTIKFFMANLTEEDATMFHFDMQQFKFEIERIIDFTTWDFLCLSDGPHTQEQTIDDCHRRCHFWMRAWMQMQPQIETRQIGRTRIVLHAFAGRRRLGDLQYYLEKDMLTDAPYDLVVVSLDIVINDRWGDATREDTRRLWLTAIRDKYVVGFVAGPPCETWSRVRGVLHPDQGAAAERGVPHVLRTLSELWGLPSLGIRELSQILTGNSLLIFTLEAIVEIALAGSVGIAEHPAEPVDLEDAASI